MKALANGKILMLWMMVMLLAPAIGTNEVLAAGAVEMDWDVAASSLNAAEKRWVAYIRRSK